MSTVLWVDSDVAMQKTICRIIAKAEFCETFKVATSGVEALEMVRHQRYDVVFVNLGMPHMSGVEIIRSVRQLSPTTKVIAITRNGDQAEVLNALRNGAFDHFGTPIDSQHLLALTHTLLKNQQLIRENRKLKSAIGRLRPLFQATVPLKILVVDDSPNDIVVIRNLLESQDKFLTDIYQARHFDDALRIASNIGLDCILLDHHLSGPGSMQFLEKMAAPSGAVEVAIIMLINEGEENMAVEGIKKGAVDYIPKSIITRDNLPVAVEGAVKKMETLRLARRLEFEKHARIRELEKTQKLLSYEATHDSLTGILNRRAILARLYDELQVARKHGIKLRVAMCDIDHFKNINDTYGHQVGDEVLTGVARRIAGSLKGNDFMGRYGGEEFLLLAHERSVNDLMYEQLRALVSDTPFETKSGKMTVTLSIGVAEVYEKVEMAIANADAALYRAKQTGRNRVVFAPRFKTQKHQVLA